MRKERLSQLLTEAGVSQGLNKPSQLAPRDAVDALLQMLGVTEVFLGTHKKAVNSTASETKKYELRCNASCAASLFSANFNSIAFFYKTSNESINFIQFTCENWENIKLTWQVIETLGVNNTLGIAKDAATAVYKIGEIIIENHEQIETVLNAAGLGGIAIDIKEAIATAGITLIFTAGKGFLFLYNRRDKAKLSELKLKNKEIEAILYLLSKGAPPEHVRPKLQKIDRSLWGY